MNKVHAKFVLAAGIAVFGVVNTLGNPLGPTIADNPYRGLYERNLAGMKLPDQTLDGVLSFDSVLTPTVGEAEDSGGIQSKTCSSTCSRTCSTTCTTTRGCKRQTDGCTGTGTAPKPAATPPVKSAVPSSTAGVTTQSLVGTGSTPSRVRDVTSRTVSNMQRALVVAGYEGLCITGSDSSPEFRLAVLDFQALNGLPATGEVNDPTWAAMQSLLSRIAR